VRTLIYVPIIHTSADLGSMSGQMAERGVAAVGEETWVRHRETVAGFWHSMWEYCDDIDAAGVNVYQDGMVADGPLGRRIAEETASAGSLNYQLVLRLLDKGARLVRTEDFGLVKHEYDRLIAMTRAKSTASKLIAVARYKLVKAALLRRRDSFIARRIDETLEPAGTGILFIGALHNVARRLAADIQIKEVKDRRKVRDYQRLLPFHSRHPFEFEALGKYLSARVAHGSF
jgi:hypothetical protein